MSDLENTTLGKYDVMRRLAGGSMGTVYLGHDPFTGRDVALKVAHADAVKDHGSESRYRKLFFNEAKVAGLLKHPNIVEVHDAGVESDTWYIVMEYVAGGRTLYDHTKPDTLMPMEDVVRWVFKCARALDYAHRKGVVHRDIKPKNVLIGDDNEIRIGDFGVALFTRADADETQVQGYVGSPLYMSPEQVREQHVTNQSDIFSLGVVLYELLTGKNPFISDRLATILYQITEKPHVPLSELRSDAPLPLQQITDRCLSKDLDGRYKTGLELATDLAAVFDSLSLQEEELPGREKFDLVRDLSFFADFNEPEIWELINTATWHEYETGLNILMEGEVDNSFYIIVSGSVNVHKGERVVDTLAHGACFGETGFSGEKQRSSGIVANEPVAVMKVRSSHIERASLNCQLRFHKVFLNALVERLSRATDRISQARA